MTLSKTALAAFLIAAPSLANAATVTVTIGDPGAMEADLLALGATASAVETFDTLGPGPFTGYASVLGTYSAGKVNTADLYGGASETQYLFSQATPGTTLTLNSPATYFGLWWSAGSGGNRVDLVSGGASIFSFNTDNVLDYLAANVANSGDYFGNPNPSYLGWVGHEPFVFINMFSDTAFDTVILSGGNFESDNHTVLESYTQQTGTSISPVPVPASLPLLAGGVGLFAILTRRRRKA